MTKYPQAVVRITAELKKYIRPQGDNYSAPTREFIEYAIAARSDARRTEIEGKFSPFELRTVAAALNGTFLEPSIIPHLHSEVREFMEDNPEWGDAEALRAKIKGLSYVARWELAEMARAAVALAGG